MRDMDKGARTLHVLIELNSADMRIGAVNDVLDLSELAAPAGVRFTLCGTLTPELRAEAATRGARTCRGASRLLSRRTLPLYAIDVMVWIARLCRLRPDVVHLNYTAWAPSLACAARLCGIPVVARAGPLIANNLVNRWIAAYIGNCRAQAADLLESPFADRVVVAGDLFRPDRVSRTLVPERPLPPLRAGAARIVFLGQLVERKGLDVLVEAFAQMKMPAQLLMAGGDWNADGLPQRIKARARELGVASRICFENHRQDVGAVLSTADIFVLPSYSEARPRSVIEAMSLGLPVVATNVGGVPSLVTDEHTGLLVPPGDAASLAAALDRLVRRPELRQRFGAAGRRRVERECRADKTALEYVRVYRRLLSVTA
jgi:glycosyltransferase involved in cell wall biosynthesis